MPEEFKTLDLEADDGLEVEVSVAPQEKPAPTKDEEKLPQKEVSERVQRRIDRLTLRAKSAEEREAGLLDRLKAAEERLTKLAKHASDTASTSLDVAENSAKDKLKLARKAFQDAYDAGDKEGLVEAQTAIAEATTEIKFIAAQKISRPPPEEKQQEQRQQQKPQYDPKAVAWAKSQDWWGKDRVMTGAALAIDAELQEQGWDASSDDYYDEIERRLRDEFPKKFAVEEEEEAPPKKTPIVAGKSRGPAANGKVTIRLTPNQLRVARTMGMTPQQYAASMKKAEEDVTDGGYSLIE